MALQKTFYSNQLAFEFPAAYIKIDNFRGNINEVQFQVYIYATQSARLEGKQPIGYYEFTIPYQDGLTYSSVYTYLKTLPGFENASDC